MAHDPDFWSRGRSDRTSVYGAREAAKILLLQSVQFGRSIKNYMRGWVRDGCGFGSGSAQFLAQAYKFGKRAVKGWEGPTARDKLLNVIERQRVLNQRTSDRGHCFFFFFYCLY